ncbi:MAG: hypothetical protein KKD08_10705 [Alphaproteobacteria bacterium]|jgi:hypothetical protein|nr:hypothetical protein [Alphaproteobacteria bacterium]
MRNILHFSSLLSIALLSSCSDEQSSSPLNEQFEVEREVSPEEMEAARSLSVVDSGAITGSNPYERAQRCSVAIGALTERVEDLGALSSEQIGVLADAKDTYERRMESEGSSNERIPQEPLAEMPSQEPVEAQAAEQGREAIACLRDLGLS